MDDTCQLNLAQDVWEEDLMTAKFDGFSSHTFRFLKNLKENNRREWFAEHKDDYLKHVLHPLQSLVEELTPTMLGIDPYFEVSPTVDKTISRIYRDTRFSKEKHPYKTGHWITFKRLQNNWKEFPAYFFEISPQSYCYGMGFYFAGRQTMDRFRALIDARLEAFDKAITAYSAERFMLEGESFKRPLKKNLDERISNWYNRKTFHLIAQFPIQSNRLDASVVNELEEAFESLAPLYQFLVKASL